MRDIETWMKVNYLLLKPEKTEVITLCPKMNKDYLCNDKVVCFTRDTIMRKTWLYKVSYYCHYSEHFE